MKEILEKSVRNHAWARVLKREKNRMDDAKKMAYDAALGYCGSGLNGRAISVVKEILGADAAKVYRERMSTPRYRNSVEMLK